MKNPKDSDAWKELLLLSAEFKHDDFSLAQLFEDDDRFDSFSVSHESLLLDYSKNFVSNESFAELIQFAEHMQLPAAINALFAGEKVNGSEGRAALHTALRAPDNEGGNKEVSACLNKMESLVKAVHSGSWKGFSGAEITDVVNIGIGGSDLGPSFVCDALADFSTGKLQLHFVSNIDPAHLDNTLLNLNPATTLFLVASKSFTTLETKQNAEAAKAWLLESAPSTDSVKHHFVAITTNANAAKAFGIDEQNLFPMWDWVGGRYSLWSAIGLSIALSIGMDRFRQLLAGAHSMDRHFQSAELGRNLPVIMGLLSVWYSGFFAAQTHAVIPYSQRLQQLPAYLQQLCMESLGKGVDKNHESVNINTGEVVWGAPGTNAQHSFFQLFHQGTQFIPVDFIAFIESCGIGADAQERHEQLLANCLSQSLALMEGKSSSENSYQDIPGNRPSTTLLVDKLDPYNLGSLIALYEHKTYVQSVVWNINPFDQWGVELGKSLSSEIFAAIQDSSSAANFDQSTANLVSRIRNHPA
ncbi:MAG: glucose-6-phosphate isomerase [Pseudomonadales bacterium]|nr:glucose-6-phosphate isomerase [Pseudomonadales bacterium]